MGVVLDGAEVEFVGVNGWGKERLIAALKAAWRKRRRGRQLSMKGVGLVMPAGLAGFWGLLAAWVAVSTALM